VNTISPDRIRRADPLAELEPAVLQEEVRERIDAIVAHDRPALRAKPRRRRLRVAVALGAATAVIAAALASLPSRDDPESAASILRSAAAVAADQPEPPPFAGYRYTESIWHVKQPRIEYRGERPKGVPDNVTWPPPPVPAHEYEQRVESWVDRDWNGRQIRHAGRLISGDLSGLGFELDKTSEDSGHLWGDKPGPKVAELPTDPAELREKLIADFKSSGDWAPEVLEHIDYEITHQVVSLLAEANTTPELRAALFGVLALTPGVQSAPDAKDPRDRPGRGVTVPGRDGTTTVIIDPDTSQLLYLSEGRNERTILRSAHVAHIGDRP
jgi:hypothetical protein